MVAISKLAYYILAIVIFIILISFLFGSDSGLSAVKEVFSGIKESVNVSIGAGEVKGEKPELPAEQKQGIELLKRKINSMKGKLECFQDYQGTLPGFERNGLPELGEEGTSIVFEKVGDDLRMILLGGVKGQQEISRTLITNANPCVISGGNVPTLFQAKLLEKLNPQTTGHYNPVERILITYDGENKISYNNGPLLDFEDGGYLYTPDGKNICFFPTNDFSTNEEGLDDNFLGNADEDSESSISALLLKDELEACLT